MRVLDDLKQSLSTTAATDRQEALALPFSDKYNFEHSLNYYQQHRSSLRKKLTSAREQQIVYKALKLLEFPATVLDVPCGTGRFWKTFTKANVKQIIGCDLSEGMLKVGQTVSANDLPFAPSCIRGSAFEVPIKKESVDCVLCVRLLHHIKKSKDRMTLLKELHRVTRSSVCLSLWVDGNYQAGRRQRLEHQRKSQSSKRHQNRFVLPQAVAEAEFKQAGFSILKHYDVLKWVTLWRFYVLVKNDAC